jgi:hypothetical protein
MKITAGLQKFAMRLPNAKNKFGIILGLPLLLTACNTLTKVTAKKTLGTWTYISVIKNDSIVFAVQPCDTLVFGSNTFRYDITSVQKHMQGNWKIIPLRGDSLRTAIQMEYLPSKQIRQFDILVINDTALIFQEKGITFTFSKRKS